MGFMLSNMTTAAYRGGLTPDWETNFASAPSGWATTDSGKIDVTGGVLSCVFERNNTHDCATIDLAHASNLGSNLSNSQWVIRFSMDNTIVQNNNNNSARIGAASAINTVDFSVTNMDALFLVPFWRNATDTNHTDVGDPDGQNSTTVTYTKFNEDLWSGKKYVEMKRLSTTSFKVEIFDNSDFTGSWDTHTETIPSGLNTLRYFRCENTNAATIPGSLTAIIDNLQVWDGVTVAT